MTLRQALTLLLLLISPLSAGSYLCIQEDPFKDAVVVYAKSYVYVGDDILYEDENGKKHKFKIKALRATIPEPPNLDEVVSATDCKVAMDSIDLAIDAAPAHKEELEDVKALWQLELDNINKGLTKKDGMWIDLAAEQQERVRKEFRSFMDAPYEEKKIYERSHVTAVVELGKKVKSGLPSKIAEIDTRLAIWKKELESIDAGMVKIDGVWTTPETQQKFEERKVQLQQKKDAERHFELEFHLDLPAEAKPPFDLTFFLLGFFGAILFLMFVIIYELFFRGGTRDWADITALVLSVNGLIGIGWGTSLLMAQPVMLPPNGGDSEVIERVSFLLDSKQPVPQKELIVSDLDANHFIARQFKPDHEFSSTMGLQRTQLQLGVSSEKIYVFDHVDWLGAHFIMSYEFEHSIQDGLFVISPKRVDVGQIPVPGRFAETMMGHLMADLQQGLASVKLPLSFQIAEVRDNQLVLKQVQLITPPSS